MRGEGFPPLRSGDNFKSTGYLFVIIHSYSYWTCTYLPPLGMVFSYRASMDYIILTGFGCLRHRSKFITS